MVENNTPESLGIHLVNLKPDSFDGDILSFEKLSQIKTRKKKNKDGYSLP